jgi:hypothetical protein
MFTSCLALLGTGRVGNTTISLLRSSLAPCTYANYDCTLRHYFFFSAAEGPPPLVRHASYYGPLHCMARPPRHRGREFYVALLFGGQQVLP